MCRLWAAPMRMPEGTVQGLRVSRLRLQEEGEDQTGRRQGTRHPAHGQHRILASGRHADVRRSSSWNHCSADCQSSSKTKPNCARCGACQIPERSSCRDSHEKGFGHDQLIEMQRIIDAEKSDLFDVLAYVAYALPPVTREERAARAKVVISVRFVVSSGHSWISFWRHYVGVGVDELDQEKLTPLLRLSTPTRSQTPFRISASLKKSAKYWWDFRSISTSGGRKPRVTTPNPFNHLAPPTAGFSRLTPVFVISLS